jgi:hypothetical protein
MRLSSPTTAEIVTELKKAKGETAFFWSAPSCALLHRPIKILVFLNRLSVVPVSLMNDSLSAGLKCIALKVGRSLKLSSLQQVYSGIPNGLFEAVGPAQLSRLP